MAYPLFPYVFFFTLFAFAVGLADVIFDIPANMPDCVTGFDLTIVGVTGAGAIVAGGLAIAPVCVEIVGVAVITVGVAGSSLDGTAV